MSNTKKKDKPENTDGNLLKGTVSYLKEVRSEWGKITWPERSQVLRETIVVILVVFFFTVLVYVLDIVFKGLLGLIPNR